MANLINARMAGLSITRTDLVKRMVFANLDKGLRRLNGYLDTGQEDSHLLQALPNVLCLNTAQVEAAAVATRQQIAEAENAAARESFRPHILALTKGVRFPFFIQAVAWHQKVMRLPNEIARLSPSKQVRQVAGIVRQHFREHQGSLGTWGLITGYRLQITFDHAVILNTDGTVREGFHRKPEPPAPELQIKGKRLPVGMLVRE